MRFQYSTTDPSSQSEYDSLPRIPLVLRYRNQQLDVVGLLDSGATVNVLPYQVGIQLGAVWNDHEANIRLAGNLGDLAAMPLFVMADLSEFAPVRLAFAWVKTNDAPLVLGQMNFFMEFDICFYRARLAFEIQPKSS